MMHFLRGLWTLIRSRRVVQYEATDHKHGLVEIEVRANRVTGSRRRYIWPEDDP